jgi:hypothetical protein
MARNAGILVGMQQPQEPEQSSQAVNDEPVLDTDELKTLAKLLDVLMEVDFELNRDERLVTNAC